MSDVGQPGYATRADAQRLTAEARRAREHLRTIAIALAGMRGSGPYADQQGRLRLTMRARELRALERENKAMARAIRAALRSTR